MQFENEKALQGFLSAVLSDGGIHNQREVWTKDKDGKIDVLSDGYAIEVKPYLNRPSLLQALGQLVTYRDSFPGRQLVVAGLTPSDERSLKSAQQVATRVEAQGVSVWWVDQMPMFKEAYYGVRQKENEDPQEYEEVEEPQGLASGWIAKAAIAFFLLILLAMCDRTQQQTAQQAVTPQQTSSSVVQSKTAIAIHPAGTELNIRGKNDKVLGVITPGETVEVLGTVQADGYIEIRRGSDRGDVFAEYLDSYSKAKIMNYELEELLIQQREELEKSNPDKDTLDELSEAIYDIESQQQAGF